MTNELEKDDAWVDEDYYREDDFIRMVAQRAGFTMSDVKIILHTMEDVIEKAVMERKSISVGFGRLYFKRLAARQGSKLVSNGEMLPPAIRAVFRLSKTLRYLLKKDAK